jgi:hypothetical protein
LKVTLISHLNYRGGGKYQPNVVLIHFAISPPISNLKSSSKAHCVSQELDPIKKTSFIALSSAFDLQESLKRPTRVPEEYRVVRDNKGISLLKKGVPIAEE